MGQEIYTAFWKNILNRLRNDFQSGKTSVQFAVAELGTLGDRKQDNYSGHVQYRFGVLQANKDSAPYRDLVLAIKSTSSIKPYLNNEFEIRVTKDLQLTAAYKQISQSDLIAAYKKMISNGNEGEVYKWMELAKPHFDLEAADFAAMIRGINFHNLIFHNAKAVLYHILNVYPDDACNAFKALFNESIDLHKRIIDFRSTMEQLYRKVEPHLPSHQDERSIATYLTYNNPNKYSLYKEAFYLKYCKLLGVAPQEVNKKYIHYLQLLKEFIDKYVKDDYELMALVDKFKPANGYKDPNHTLLAQDILYKTLESSWGEDDPEVEKKSSFNNIHMPALNTILFGPPGTGKTYNTIESAIRITNPDFFNTNHTRQQVRQEFERLKSEGQIEFITFHQSMSYEDFIEGIKPKSPEEGDTYLKYEIQEGIFKRMVARANYKPTPQATVFSLSDDEFSKASFYKVSLGNTAIADDEQIYHYCIDNGLIGLGWGGAIDFNLKTEHDIQLMVPAELSKFEAQAVNYFIHYLKKDDYVVISYGNLRFRAIGRVSGDYEYRNVEGLEVKQFRKVEWLLKDVDIPVEELYNKQFSQQTIYKLNRSEIKREFFVKGNVSQHDGNTLKNYVLIIDEINRGNIAQIFGELITLIEPDKRKGATEALEVMLPYSKEAFSVPSNLFILGTMNTADRSVEALDTALRRRFVFEEMLPKPELLSPQRMVWNLWWDYTHQGWDEQPYSKTEKGVYELLGLPPEFGHDDKLWTPMKNEGRKESQIVELDSNEFTGVNLQSLLQAINVRLETLLTRDHAIGHAYLMDVKSISDLRDAFAKKVMPLFQEYFYNDYVKIGWVIGEDFFERPANKEIAFATFSYSDDSDASDFDRKPLLRFKKPHEWTKDSFIKVYDPAYKAVDKIIEEATHA